MNTQEFIEQLSSNLQPVKKLASPIKRYLRWLAASALCVGVALSFLGLRHDFYASLHDPMVLLEIILILSLALLSALGAFILSTPHPNPKKWMRTIPLVALGVWFFILAGDFYFHHSHSIQTHDLHPRIGLDCVGDLLTLALVPGLILLVMIKKAAPTSLGWAGFLGLLSVASLGALGSQMMCSNNHPAHLFVWHFTPVIFLGLLGIFLGKKLLHW